MTTMMNDDTGPALADASGNDDAERDEIELSHVHALIGLIHHLAAKTAGDITVRAARAAEVRAIKYVLTEFFDVDVPAPRARRLAPAPEVIVRGSCLAFRSLANRAGAPAMTGSEP